MSAKKSIRGVLQPPPFHMVGDGFRVHNFFPSSSEVGMTGMSPFFLLDYNSKWDVPPSDRQRGVGVHPHRGFETVTIAYHGRVAHHDSTGNSGVIREGDVQWMTAGAGILHKEYHEKEFSKKGGVFQVVQLWVNLPAKFKMTPPKYQAIENSMMGKYYSDDKKILIDVIAGNYNGVKGPASTFSPMHLYNASFSSRAKTVFSFPDTYNTGILVIEGEIRFNGSQIAAEDHFILFNHNGNEIEAEALKDSKALIMSGEPIREPVVSYGPFVMNSDSEIKLAYEDYYNGKFGFLKD